MGGLTLIGAAQPEGRTPRPRSVRHALLALLPLLAGATGSSLVVFAVGVLTAVGQLVLARSRAEPA
jgi:hypothetical protein